MPRRGTSCRRSSKRRAVTVISSTCSGAGVAGCAAVAGGGVWASAARICSATLSASAAAAKTAAQQFMAYANMTPAQRMQAEMLSQLGLTEDQFKALPPAEQQKVEEKIQQMIKQQLQKNAGQTGQVVDVSA